MTRCIGEPISWLALERYGLGELGGSERDEIAQHLEVCPACRQCWARIEEDGGRALQPLAAVSNVRSLARARAGRWAWLGALGAVAAAAALVVWRGDGPGLEPPASKRAVKGGEVAMELVRQGSDGELREPTRYRPGDRFKVLLTCPPPWRGTVQVVVYQDGRAYFPLEAETIEACGNRRELPGAFAIDGESPAVVCVATWAEGEGNSREQLERGVEGLPEGSVCEEVGAGG